MPPNPSSSKESSMGSNSSIKSSWQLTTVPLGACRSNVSQKSDHPWLCLCPVLFHQADGRDPAEAWHSREALLCPPLSAAAAAGTQLTKAQPVFTNKILPTSTGHTLAAQKPQESHSGPTTMGICRQLLPPAAVGKPCTLPWREGQ